MIIKRKNFSDTEKGAAIGLGVGAIGSGGVYLSKRRTIPEKFDKDIQEYNKSSRKYRKYLKDDIKSMKKINKRRRKELDERLKKFKGQGHKANSIEISKHDRDLYNDLVKQSVNKSHIDRRKNELAESLKEQKYYNSARYKRVTIGRQLQKLNKNFMKKAPKVIAATTALGTGLGYAKSRGELDKDHLKASASINPVHAISGHLGVNKGDKSRESGKDVYESSNDAKKLTRNIDLAGTGVATAGTAILGGKLLDKKVQTLKNSGYNNPVIKGMINGLKPGLVDTAKEYLVGKHKNKTVAAMTGVVALSGIAGSTIHSNRVKHIVQNRLNKKDHYNKI